MKYFLYLNNDIVKESLIKLRLMAQHASCLHISRHLAQKFLDRRQPACVISIQSDVVSPCRGGVIEADRGADRQIKI